MNPRKIMKVGNSYAVTIPLEMLRYLEIKPTDWVILTAMEPGTIIIERLEPKRRRSLFIPGTGRVKSKNET